MLSIKFGVYSLVGDRELKLGVRKFVPRTLNFLLILNSHASFMTEGLNAGFAWVIRAEGAVLDIIKGNSIKTQLSLHSPVESLVKK